ncbi:hypothetical protein NMF47_09660 [Serratia nevei]|uniref:hypothetical protein n=1 Tax=Serratia TaxID=613 RepID=UPI0027E3BF0D|nr:hypothetical protein [Serratia nevei]MDQ7768756.1 hypothetical protein [Serratia nevei]HEJ9150596.1 hypothetical protein [Serratia marcescens]
MNDLELNIYFVAFIDILGFSSMVSHDCERASSEKKFLTKLNAIHNETKSLSDTIPGIDVKQFSDSIVLSTPYSKDTVLFQEFVEVVCKYQYHLLMKGILCRGGISYGKHFSNKDFIFSNGLIDAYRIESTIARNPRIIVSNELIELFPLIVEHHMLAREHDGYYFLNYLLANTAAENWDLIKAVVPNKMVENSSIREKHIWLLELYNKLYPNSIVRLTERFTFS